MDAPVHQSLLIPRSPVSRPRRWPRVLVAVLAAIGLFAAGWWAGSNLRTGTVSTEDQVTPTTPTDEQNTIDVLSRFAPSTASLQVVIAGENTTAGKPQGGPQQSAGSGFVVDVHGQSYLVTNYHVVQAALVPDAVALRDDALILAAFPGHDPVRLKVVGVNPSFDLALLQATSVETPLPAVEPIPIADSDLVETGQKAIAIGNPFGFDSTATVGVVSATGRFLESVGEVAVPMIQTDAAINPGNSGGALLNSAGELIGVNTSIFNPNAGSFAGLGFAVPSNLLSEALANLELGGVSDISDTRPSLGVELASLAFYPPQVRADAELPDKGVMVVGTVAGGSAEQAGLRGADTTVEFGRFRLPVGGDVLLAVDGVEIPNADTLNRAVTYGLSPGDVVELLVLRGGEEHLIDVVVE